MTRITEMDLLVKIGAQAVQIDALQQDNAALRAQVDALQLRSNPDAQPGPLPESIEQ